MSRLVEDLLSCSQRYHKDAGNAEKHYNEYRLRLRASAHVRGPVILGFLVDWGGPSTARSFPVRSRTGLTRQLDTWHERHNEVLIRLANCTLWESNLREVAPDICDLFDGLRGLEQPRSNGRTFGSTATAKTLHLLLPNLCAIWDQRVIRGSLELDEQAWAYISYLRLLRSLATEAIEEFVTEQGGDKNAAVERLVASHRGQTEAEFDEPITKILDEAAYKPGFRRTWMAPLRDRIEMLPWA